MSDQPVVFNMQYTPYKLQKGKSADNIAKHAEERAFYNMTGENNIYKYITTEDKLKGKFTVFEYLQKNTGVFNDKGMISQEQVDEMKARLKENKGHIFHGFISIDYEQSHKIDCPEKCIELIKRTFPKFLADAKFHKDNVDLMCALHLDRPHHLHIHFVFWEKEPKYKNKDGKLRYRRLGKIDKKSIDNMFVRLRLYLSDKKYRVYKSRDTAIAELKELLGVRAVMASDDRIKKEILSLAKDLPKTGRITYGSKDMENFRPRADYIVKLLLGSDQKAMKANRRFYEAVAEREREVKDLSGSSTVLDELKSDYKRRQGNLVLNLCKFIKPEFFECKHNRKPNDTRLKRSLGMSRRKIDRACKKFFRSFGAESELLERDFCSRLREIEEEIERERKKNRSSELNNTEVKEI